MLTEADIMNMTDKELHVFVNREFLIRYFPHNGGWGDDQLVSARTAHRIVCHVGTDKTKFHRIIARVVTKGQQTERVKLRRGITFDFISR